MYIVIEGIDTAGKSTQVERLKTAFPDALFTKEPGATPVGSKIRDIVLNHEVKSARAEMLLFMADRAEHIDTVVAPNQNSMIISDRSLISGMAYARVQNLFDDETLVRFNRFATADTMPDLAIILQLTPEALAHRLAQKAHDSIEARGTEYLLRIQDALIESAAKLGIPTVIVDATDSIDAISQKIIATIKGDS